MPIIIFINIAYGYPEYRQNNNNRRAFQQKTSITNQISEQEKLEAETALRSLKMKMANKGKKPIRQTNTANQMKRAPNYNNYNNMNQRQNYNNNMNYNNYNDINYNYSPNISEIGKNQNIYGGIKANENKKPITANQYNRNHNYNNMDINNDNIYNNKNMNFNTNQYSLNQNNYKNNNYNNNYNSNYNNNYNNNYKNNNIRRRNNNNYNIHNYNNIQDNENDERPIGGGLTADQMPQENSPTSPCPHCGRSFNSQALTKHVKICEKVFLKKRKAFNTQKQRIQDSEQASLMKQGAMEEKRNPLLNNKKSGGIPKWKLQSMAFRAICNPGKNPAPNQLMNNNKYSNMMGKNNNKGINKNMMNKNINMGNNAYNIGSMGMGNGGFVSNAMAYDYKHCDFCNRNYNEEAYNKHLNFCKRRYENEKLKNKAKKQINNTAKKNQNGNSLSGGVKYNNGKYNKKK